LNSLVVILLVRLIAVKHWDKTLLDDVDPYHLGIRFVGFLTVILLLIYICYSADEFAAGVDKPRHWYFAVVFLICPSRGDR
jgi:hypothetical protein